MSHAAVRVTPQDFAPPPIITRMRSFVIPVGVVFGVLALIGAIFKWELFLRAWLFAFVFWLALTTGSLVLLMLQYTSGGNWGRVGRRIWEAAAGNWLVMLACWLPIAFGIKLLYPWANVPSDATKYQEFLNHFGPEKIHWYLNPAGFWARGIIYFAVWAFFYYKMMQWSRREEAGETTPAKFVNIQNWSGFGIVVYAATITFASIDWTMSLYPEWWSTVWGMLAMVGQVLTTLSFTIWLLVKLAPVEPLSGMFKTDYLHDFGKLMFAFVVLWAYLSFSQWLIIWSGNMLNEIRWYLMRLAHGWQYFGTILILLHFVFPFSLLLSRNLKRHGRRVMTVAVMLMFMRMVDLFWITAPNFYRGAEAGLTIPGAQTATEGLINFGWWDAAMYIVCPIAMGGIWLFFFFRRLEQRSLMPVNDPHFVEMLEAKHG